jgi:hypothetical protein
MWLLTRPTGQVPGRRVALARSRSDRASFAKGLLQSQAAAKSPRPILVPNTCRELAARRSGLLERPERCRKERGTVQHAIAIPSPLSRGPSHPGRRHLPQALCGPSSQQLQDSGGVEATEIRPPLLTKLTGLFGASTNRRSFESPPMVGVSPRIVACHLRCGLPLVSPTPGDEARPGERPMTGRHPVLWWISDGGALLPLSAGLAGEWQAVFREAARGLSCIARLIRGVEEA